MKVYNYSFLMIGIILLFEMAGIETGASGLLNLVGIGTSSFSLTTSTFWNTILGSAGILVGVAAGIAIGFITKSSPENFIILPFIFGTMGLFVQSFGSIITYSLTLSSWVSSIIILLLAPLTVMYVFALVEFFRGTD